MSEETFTVVGTAKSPSGLLKVRWTNNLWPHYDRITRQGCSEIDFHETPNAMTKLEALEWLMANKELTEEQKEIVYLKKAEKIRKKRKLSLSSPKQ